MIVNHRSALYINGGYWDRNKVLIHVKNRIFFWPLCFYLSDIDAKILCASDKILYVQVL